MSKHRSAGQRRAEKVLARRRRARGGGTVCGGTGCPGTGGAVAAEAPVAPLPREPDGLDRLLEADGVEDVSLLLRDAVTAAVARTLADRSAEAGELLATRLRDLDDDYADTVDVDEHCQCCDLYVDPDDGPSEWAQADLVGPLMSARDRWRGPGLADEVVAWVATHLDRRGPSIEERAGHLGGVPGPRPGPGEGLAEWIREMVEQPEVAALVWLVSGLVAVAGDGDIAWLEQLR